MKVIAISDQHGYLPDVPECDLLVVAGDLAPDWFPRDVRQAQVPPWTTAQRPHGMVAARRDGAPQLEWFETVWLEWRRRQPAGFCIWTPGNHDYFGRLLFRHASVAMSGTDTAGVVDAEIAAGGLRIWCTPWSSQFRDWAWMATEQELAARQYAPIPAGLDLLVSHQPPYGYCDLATEDGLRAHKGSEALLDVMEFKQPKAIVCGHLHGGYGISTSNVAPAHTRVYNVAVLDEQYRPAHAPTVIEL